MRGWGAPRANVRLPPSDALAKGRVPQPDGCLGHRDASCRRGMGAEARCLIAAARANGCSPPPDGWPARAIVWWASAWWLPRANEGSFLSFMPAPRANSTGLLLVAASGKRGRTAGWSISCLWAPGASGLWQAGGCLRLTRRHHDDLLGQRGACLRRMAVRANGGSFLRSMAAPSSRLYDAVGGLSA